MTDLLRHLEATLRGVDTALQEARPGDPSRNRLLDLRQDLLYAVQVARDLARAGETAQKGTNR